MTDTTNAGPVLPYTPYSLAQTNGRDFVPVTEDWSENEYVAGYTEKHLSLCASAYAEQVAGPLRDQLGQCFRLSGADPDGNENWRLAPRAVDAVRQLRADYDEACDEAEKLQERVKELESLSVTSILIEIVPGDHGMGSEIYAKSVEDVEDAIQREYQRTESVISQLRERVAELERELLALKAGAQRVENLCKTISADRDRLRAENEALSKVLDTYEAQTKALPAQHEIPERGCSTYNWRMACIRDLRSMISAARAARGVGR